MLTAAVTSRGKRPLLANGPRMNMSRSSNMLPKEQVRHVRNQLPASNRLLEEEEYEHRTGRTLGRRQAIRDHWHCPFFRYCWNSGMSRLSTIDDC